MKENAETVGLSGEHHNFNPTSGICAILRHMEIAGKVKGKGYQTNSGEHVKELMMPQENDH